MRLYKINRMVGKRIAKIRKGRRNDKGRMLTQEDLADLVGIHRNHIGRIERGETSPPLPLIEKIARVLKTPISSLFEN